VRPTSGNERNSGLDIRYAGLNSKPVWGGREAAPRRIDMDTITKKVLFVPLRSGESKYIPGRTYYEQIIMRIDNYPCAMFHIDTLFVKGHSEDNEIYRRLDKGEAVECLATFKISDADTV
jgi:hypothetical protein